jgi:alpha-L-fucosidase 2
MFPALLSLVLLTQPTDSLVFDRPAARFTESAPVGNGRLGAMVFGGTTTETIVLNEISLWSGRVLDQNREGAWKNRAAIVDLLMQGKNTEAEQLVNHTFTCDGPGSSQGNALDGPYGCYQVLGTLTLRSDSPDAQVSGYERWLDLANAECVTKFSIGGSTFTREVIASYPDDVVACRITAAGDRPLDLVVSLSRPQRASITVDGSDLVMRGQLNDGEGGTQGLKYVCRARALVDAAGTVTPVDGGLRISGAREAIVLVSAATSYSGPIQTRYPGDRYESFVRETLDAAAARPWTDLVARHREDFRALEGRVTLDLGAAPKDSTHARLLALDKGEADPALASLLFRYGRYLLISSSRAGGLPANLQGLWAEELQTPWNGDYHTNINVQMNYWPAEVGALPECHLPLVSLIEALREPGGRTAAAYYNAPGWVVHVITNVWGYTAPGESASWGSTLSGGAWLCAHLWQHFEFTRDTEYLRRVYPILRDASAFYHAVLVELPDGRLVTAPSNSPENSFRLANGQTAHTCLGPTMDQQLLRELFSNTVAAAEILDIDPETRTSLRGIASRLAPHAIAPDGRLQEWLEPYEEPEPSHRHVSHLYGLYPAHQITLHGTPELAAAARKSLERRGDRSTGWSMAWKACFWARLGDGDRAESLLRQALTPVADAGFDYHNRGGSYPNLFGAHPPFQIDSNFGAAAAVAEMLLQSHPEREGEPPTINILPALPKAWPSGRVTGLRARGGLTVDVQWEAGALTRATVRRIPGSVQAADGVFVRVPGIPARFPLQLDGDGAWEWSGSAR